MDKDRIGTQSYTETRRTLHVVGKSSRDAEVRNFLKSPASAFPFVLSQSFALGTEPSDFPIKEAHVVLAGEDIDGESRTLGFSRISFMISNH